MNSQACKSLINERDLVIVQRGSYLKSCRINSKSIQKFGKPGESQTNIKLACGIGCVYGSNFRLIPTNNKTGPRNTYDLELTSNDLESNSYSNDNGSNESEIDNRNLINDGSSQSLSKYDIQTLVNAGATGDQMIQTLTNNSKTFKRKTKFSQEKYVNKKQKKYDEFISIHKPSIRLLVKMFYFLEPLRISNLRIDSLCQLLAYANVKSGGRYLVYEAGVQGLISAAVLDRVRQYGSIVVAYSGNCPHKESVELMNFSKEELTSISYLSSDYLPIVTDNQFKSDHSNLSNNFKSDHSNLSNNFKSDSSENHIYSDDNNRFKLNLNQSSVSNSCENNQLPCSENSQSNLNLDQSTLSSESNQSNVSAINQFSEKEAKKQPNGEFKDKLAVNQSNNNDDKSSQVMIISQSNEISMNQSCDQPYDQSSEILASNAPDQFSERESNTSESSAKRSIEDSNRSSVFSSPNTSSNLPKNARKFVRSKDKDVELSRNILKHGVHGLIVACRQHPSSITIALLSYLLPGHSFAIFSPYKETLIDLFMDLKQKNCINLRLFENWLRNYQVMPERTHPEVTMSGGGGYILTGYKTA